jgi:uncharacterized membrane protein
MARSLANVPVTRLVGVTGSRRVVDVHKDIWIDAPVTRVFDFWREIANFPRFMSHLAEVRDLGGGRSHWVANGPAGVPVHWDAAITRMIPNEMIAWRTEPGSPVRHAGIVNFEPVNGGTQVRIRLTYNPPGGALGATVARMFGADPKSEMDDDLVRLKSLIEDGRTTAHGTQVTLDEVRPPKRLTR